MKRTYSHTRVVLALLVLAIVATTSCKKDSTSSSSGSSTQALFSGSWKLTTFEIKKSDSTWITTTPPSFLSEYAYTFKSDGTYTLTSAGYQSGTGTWSIYDNCQTMQLGSTPFHIAVLNSTNLQLVDKTETFPYVINGQTATYYGERETYSH